jgi:hypothetical protein
MTVFTVVSPSYFARNDILPDVVLAIPPCQCLEAQSPIFFGMSGGIFGNFRIGRVMKHGA